jgi:hypothetical protein
MFVSTLSRASHARSIATDDGRVPPTKQVCVRVLYRILEGKRAGAAARLAIVQVSSQPRHRHKVVTEIIFASVSMTLLPQQGHNLGRMTG